MSNFRKSADTSVPYLRSQFAQAGRRQQSERRASEFRLAPPLGAPAERSGGL